MRARLLVNVPRADIVTDRSGSPAAPGLLQTGRWDETDRLERSNDPSRPTADLHDRRLCGIRPVIGRTEVAGRLLHPLEYGYLLPSIPRRFATQFPIGDPWPNSEQIASRDRHLEYRVPSARARYSRAVTRERHPCTRGAPRKSNTYDIVIPKSIHVVVAALCEWCPDEYCGRTR
jgi:hypothetical protein